MTDDKETFDEWAVLELMGHRRLAGHVSEVTLAGGTFLRIDVPNDDNNSETLATQFYSPAAVYCITPTTEDTARAVARNIDQRPIQRYQVTPVAAVEYDNEAPF